MPRPVLLARHLTASERVFGPPPDGVGAGVVGIRFWIVGLGIVQPVIARSISIVLLLAAAARAEGFSSDAFHDVGPELRRSIDAAIAAGVRFITDDAKHGEFPALISKGMSQGGQHMLIVYTLLASGVDPESTLIKKAFKARVATRLTDKHHINYARAVAVLAYAKRIDALRQKYAGAGKLPGKAKSAIAWSRREIADLSKRVADSQARGIWRYPGTYSTNPSDPEDLSATQYVLLSLRAAREHGVKFEDEVFEKAITYLVREQEATGPETKLYYRASGKDAARYGKLRQLKRAHARGWSYKPRLVLEARGKQPKFTGAMTAAGVGSLAICKEALIESGALKPKRDTQRLRTIDRALEDGWAKLGADFNAGRSPKGGWHYYYLYGVERVGAFLGVPNMGDHWWFKEGAAVLIKQQQDDGSWKEKGGNQTRTVQTCFALLFLNRVTKEPAVPIRPPVVSGR